MRYLNITDTFVFLSESATLMSRTLGEKDEQMSQLLDSASGAYRVVLCCVRMGLTSRAGRIAVNMPGGLSVTCRLATSDYETNHP
jgi:hypothetical protein